MNSVPERKELPVEKTWNLVKYYNSDEEWEKDFTSIEPLLQHFQSFKERLAESPALLFQSLKAYDELDRRMEKVYVYAHLKEDEDMANGVNSARLGRVSAKFADINGETAWLEPEILAMDESRLKEFTKSPELKFYEHTLSDLLRDRPHTLSSAEERLLGMASDAFMTPQKTFSMLNDADLRFPKVPDSSGKRIELTHGNYIKLLENPLREVRKSAFGALYRTYTKFRNTFATTLDGAVKTHVLKAKIRNHSSPLAAALHDDNVPESVYRNLIETVRSHLPELHRYFDLRRKVLKLEKLDIFDLYNPLVPECNASFTWEEACALVIDAFRPLGGEYCEIVRKALMERWIDVMECRGKRSGAYSSGSYDSVPYMLMNFNGTLNDVFTLAHELGHSMHSWYSNDAQDYHYANYSIFVAEVASTVNELLLHHHLLEKEKDRNLRINLLCHLADEIRGTVFRQTMFADFEKTIHEIRAKGNPLTADELCSLYFKINREYHGSPVGPDKKIRMEWARIPHFYYNFYVYKYATGFSAASMISSRILDGSRSSVENHLNFLKSGSTKYPLELLDNAGVSLTTPEPLEFMAKIFRDTVRKLESELL